jgi:hypothetical protein
MGIVTSSKPWRPPSNDHEAIVTSKAPIFLTKNKARSCRGFEEVDTLRVWNNMRWNSTATHTSLGRVSNPQTFYKNSLYSLH